MSKRVGRDTAAGLFFIAIGIIFYWGSSNLTSGTASRMATGDFPRLLSCLLMLLGVIIAAKGAFITAKTQAAPLRFDAARLMVMCFSLIFFALALESLGLWITLSVFTAVNTALLFPRSLKETILITVAIDVFIGLVFIVGIGLEIPLSPIFWR